MSSPATQKAVNRGVARAIPVLLLAIISYAIFTFVDQLCVNYLLRPPPPSIHPSRPGTAAGLLTGFFILLLPVLITFARLLYIIGTNPGILPRGALYNDRRRRRDLALPAESEKPTPVTPGDLRCSQPARQHNRRNRTSDSIPLEDQRNVQNPPPGLEAYYNRPLFACESDGYPRWCAKCLEWKPERAHHCSEVGRCVQKLDHFCPWVGGVVSITSFKFFIQFVTYAAMLCIYVLAVLAYFTAEQDGDAMTEHTGRRLNVHWIVSIALSGLLGLFTLGMSGTSLHLASINSSTIENFDRKTKVWQLAVLLPDPDAPVQTYATSAGAMAAAHKVTFPPASYLERLPAGAPRPPTRTFAVLRALPGQNPWDCGVRRNFCDVMGRRWYDWFLPLRHSPLIERGPDESLYPTGRVVRKLMRKGGITVPGRRRASRSDGTMSGAEETGRSDERRRERRRRRRRSTFGDDDRDQRLDDGSGEQKDVVKGGLVEPPRPDDSAVSGMS